MQLDLITHVQDNLTSRSTMMCDTGEESSHSKFVDEFTDTSPRDIGFTWIHAWYDTAPTVYITLPDRYCLDDPSKVLVLRTCRHLAREPG
jgi:hypothetical protein